ncbi:MAG: PTS sugar transporter subunit IIC [Elusimicrobiaceae bacterium]|nr:PTS sugar transporter subunit IIC [Elusimicrobiaceae bacterium]
MLLSLAGLCALVAFLELDTTYVGQFLISRPMFIGAMLGALTGNLLLGLQIGIFTELIYIDYLPLGGTVPPSGTITATIAILMNYFFSMDIYFAFFVGIICGQSFAFVERFIRDKRAAKLENIEKQLIKIKITPGVVIIKSLILEFVVVFVFLVLCMIMFGPLFVYLHEDISEKVHIAFKFSYYIIPWVGLCGLLMSFSNKPKED